MSEISVTVLKYIMVKIFYNLMSRTSFDELQLKVKVHS
jgi:hypothetical protein